MQESGEESGRTNDTVDRAVVDLVPSLRAEANTLKECFTKYSVQAVSFSGVILAIVIRSMFTEPRAGFGSLAILVIVFATTRLGTYKYAAANRHFGYELHLYRTRRAEPQPGVDVFGNRWKDEMRYVGWEEAMRAWRVVQATLFETIYNPLPLLPTLRRKTFKANGEWWFCQQSMIRRHASVRYYPGSYLWTFAFFSRLS